MKKNIHLSIAAVTILLSIVFINPSSVYAAVSFNSTCNPAQDVCEAPFSCIKVSNNPQVFKCRQFDTSGKSDFFGKIEPPDAISNLGFGAQGISNVLNKGIELLFIVAGIIFVFMIVISAVQWIVSGGDKEGIGKARGRLTAAIVGIVLLSLAFVIIRVVGQITGFEFFAGQNNPPPPPLEEMQKKPYVPVGTGP